MRPRLCPRDGLEPRGRRSRASSAKRSAASRSMGKRETTAPPSFQEQLRDSWRAVVPWLTGAGLWVAMPLFLVWSFAYERDSLVTGIVTGSLFALGAIGITLIYGILKWGHFAHEFCSAFRLLGIRFLTGSIAGTRHNPAMCNFLPVSTSDSRSRGQNLNFSFGYVPLLTMVFAAGQTAIMTGGPRPRHLSPPSPPQERHRRLLHRSAGRRAHSAQSDADHLGVRTQLLQRRHPSGDRLALRHSHPVRPDIHPRRGLRSS